MFKKLSIIIIIAASCSLSSCNKKADFGYLQGVWAIKSEGCTGDYLLYIEGNSVVMKDKSGNEKNRLLLKKINGNDTGGYLSLTSGGPAIFTMTYTKDNIRIKKVTNNRAELPIDASASRLFDWERCKNINNVVGLNKETIDLRGRQ